MLRHRQGFWVPTIMGVHTQVSPMDTHQLPINQGALGLVTLRRNLVAAKVLGWARWSLFGWAVAPRKTPYGGTNPSCGAASSTGRLSVSDLQEVSRIVDFCSVYEAFGSGWLGFKDPTLSLSNLSIGLSSGSRCRRWNDTPVVAKIVEN